jgi:hypothetical protein
MVSILIKSKGFFSRAFFGPQDVRVAAVAICPVQDNRPAFLVRATRGAGSALALP